MPENLTITVQTEINAPIDKVWKLWNTPKDIMQWNNMSADWHTPKVENDVRTGGRFLFVMGLKDGSFSFDFEGVYSNVEEYALIEYTMADGRWVKISFSGDDKTSKVVEEFVPENQNPVEMQKGGWQAILDNFKKHVEAN